MNTLSFAYATRPGEKTGTHAVKSERKYIDFVVSEQSLGTLLEIVKKDLIGAFGWSTNHAYENQKIDEFLSLEKPELESGRTLFYVCAECGDIECGAITAEIEVKGDTVTWKNFGFENNIDEPDLSAYKHIGPFQFDKIEYVELFEEIKQTVN